MPRYFNTFTFVLLAVTCALCFYACGGDSSSSSSPKNTEISKGSVFDVVDTEYESGDLVSVVAYDSESGDTLHFNVVGYGEESGRYYLEEEDSEDTFAAKVNENLVKIIEVNPDIEKSSDSKKKSSSSQNSSSSAKSSSSSSEEESSSSVRKFSIIEENDEMSFDLSKMKMVDKRDSREYGIRLESHKLVMTENLQYEVEDSWCYNNYEKNCERYGRMYTWLTAYNENSFSCSRWNTNTICPEGWTVNSTPIKGLYSGIRSEDGYFKYILRQGWAWSLKYAESGWSEKPCDTYFMVVEDTYPEESGQVMLYYNGRMRKTYALPVSCVYRDSIFVPDSVKLPEVQISVPDYKAPAPLTTYNGPFGELVDERDGNIYKTVEIGTQTWMAENLRYVLDSSYCKNGITADTCAKYENLGRMYQWNLAHGLERKFSPDTVEWPVQGVCPNGWHIPTLDDWKTLFNLVLDATDGTDLSTPLYATEWEEGVEGGTDAFGFGMKASGAYHNYTGLTHYRTGIIEYMVSDKDDKDRLIVRFDDPEEKEDGGLYYDSENDIKYPHIRCVKGQGSRPILPPEPEEPEEPEADETGDSEESAED